MADKNNNMSIGSAAALAVGGVSSSVLQNMSLHDASYYHFDDILKNLDRQTETQAHPKKAFDLSSNNSSPSGAEK